MTDRSPHTPPIDLRNGGKVDVRDYGDQVVIEVSFPSDSEGIIVASATHERTTYEVELRERWT